MLTDGKAVFEITADQVQKNPPFRAGVEPKMIDTYPGTFPLGGFGSGTIGLAPDGTFLDWHFFSGIHLRESLSGCVLAFCVPQLKKCRVLAGKQYTPFLGWEKLHNQELKNLTFRGSYPLSSLTYEEKSFSIEIGAFSPVIPHNYKETSFPVAIFPIKLKNKSKRRLTISFLFSFQNLIGYSYEKADENSYKFKDLQVSRKNYRKKAANIECIFFKGENNQGLNGEFCLAGKVSDEVSLHLCTNYDPYKNSEIWQDFKKNGTIKEHLTLDSANKCGAIVLQATLNPNDEIEAPLALSWDLFSPGDQCQKYFLQFFEKRGENSYEIAKQALFNYQNWHKEISDWQKTVLCNKSLSKPYKQALFNELYCLANSSLWDKNSGLFTYLESFDFPFYDTLDVRYYGAFPLAMLWPKIEKKVISFFAKTINKEHKIALTYNQGLQVINKKLTTKSAKETSFRKIKGALPHDLGSPFENVWQKINAYTWQNPNRWKDLNSKFILQVYRCYYLSGKKDLEFLRKNLEEMEQAAEYLLTSFDIDGDFLPENEGFPDQTFDNWKMQGVSAYCGNLFLAALRVLAHVEQLLRRNTQAKRYRQILKLAKDSYIDKLWQQDGRGGYFRFDEQSSLIMTAQMMGEWYLKILALPPVLPEKMIKQSLASVYRYNFKKKHLVPFGLINSNTETSTNQPPQARAVWTGINYAFASHLYSYGYIQKAKKIIRAISQTTYQKGFFYRTPESWNLQKEFVSSMYMRPGAIWSIEVARNV